MKSGREALKSLMYSELDLAVETNRLKIWTVFEETICDAFITGYPAALMESKILPFRSLQR